MGRNNWSRDETRMLLELRQVGLNYNQISLRVGRSPDACSKRMKYVLDVDTRAIMPGDPRIDAALRGGTFPGRKERVWTSDSHVTIPPGVAADRERRAALRPRDLTAAFHGDPLPGYSALDRRVPHRPLITLAGSCHG